MHKTPSTSFSPPALLVEPLSPEAALRQVQAQARYFFEPAEFGELVRRDPTGPTVKKMLHRLAQQGLITLATKRPAGWLIVPPEQAHYGAPPVTWWIDACLSRMEPHYYVALHSAARHWGSSHYALQTTQVMVKRPRYALTPGNLKVEFISKKFIEGTPTMRVESDVAPWRVSTPEATLLDLIRHQSEMGGIESLARISKDFSKSMTSEGLLIALEAMDQAPVGQRLGFILEHLGQHKSAHLITGWLSKRRLVLQPLESRMGNDERLQIIDKRWALRFDPARMAIFEELQ